MTHPFFKIPFLLTFGGGHLSRGSKLNLSREEVKEFREKAYQALTNLGWPITSRSNKGKDKKSLRYLTVTSQVANSFERELEAISYSNVIFDLLASNFLDQARKVSSNVLSSLQEDLARNLSRELRGNASDEEEIRVKYFQRRSSGRFGSEFGTEEEDLDSKRQRIESELEQLEITSSELEKLEKRFLSLPLTPSSDGGDGRKGRIRDSRFPTTLTSTPSTPRRNVDGGSFNASQSSPTKRKRRGAADGDLDEDLAQLEFEQDFGSLHPSPRKKLF
ncbi:hypothetical protein IE53DRAFT_361446 [Violaceomyces palustris]|uniref:Uncharacterized protein n=1 Tax=Violaceomyces palustris TaxID=1673888 RepID=A0ACD0P0Q4_9BASI|nr:hypothetical protein IE53DRAFT_361446 [Violaceomyces palustris]